MRFLSVVQFRLRSLQFLLLVCSAVAGWARNDVEWNFVNLPTSGSVGQMIYFNAGVTNRGDRAWTGAHYLEMRDGAGAHLNYIGLGTINPSDMRTAAFSLRLPAVPGTYTYHFQALEHGVEYFGPSIARTITVQRSPLDVSLEIEDDWIIAGQSTAVVSAAGPDERVAAHGIEARILGGRWQTWAEWDGAAREPRRALAAPTVTGVYEVRAYAVREGEEPSFSSRATLRVDAIAPRITREPAGAMATVGEAVSLSVVADGTDPVFQWRKDGVDLPGASTATLALTPARVNESGTYSVTVANSAGVVTSRAVTVIVAPQTLPALSVTVSNFPAGASRRTVALDAARVGDVITVQSVTSLVAGAGWRHNLLVRRPGLTPASAMAPEDGSGLSNAFEAWNRDGWGNPHGDGGAYDSRVTGVAAVDLGNREPFMHALATGQAGSTRTMDFVLDAPGTWQLQAEVVDGAGQPVANSAVVNVTVGNAPLPGDPAELTYPYGRDDKVVGVFWNAGQAHRLWSTWRAEFQGIYPAAWATNWKLMWQPSPYFRRADGGWLRPDPTADSPWQPFWSAHQVYALVPDGTGQSVLTHDLTSQTFAERAALRLMDIGVDFVAVDYTNQFLEEREDVLPALTNLAQAFQVVGARAPSGQRVKLAAVVPANITSGDWAGNGGFTAASVARFNAKLNLLYLRYARYESAWFHLQDDDGARKPLLMLWIGAGGEGEPDGRLSTAYLEALRLADGRRMTDVFTIRWVGAYLGANRRFLTGATYTATGPAGAVTGPYANAKLWSYHETFPSAASVAPGAIGAAPSIEAITVQPLAAGRDRFGRSWDQNWPAGQGYHYETPATRDPVPLAQYGRTWSEALAVARALNPKILLTTWAEFGSENDEPRPELAVTIMDNNKFGTHFGDALKQTVRAFKYRAPTGWIDTVATEENVQWISEIGSDVLALRDTQTVRLQGWVNPNVSTAFSGGRVKIFIDDQYLADARVGGAWNNATRWTFDLSGAVTGIGRHVVKVLFDDGVGGTALAGVRFRTGAARSELPILVTIGRTDSTVSEAPIGRRGVEF